MANPTNSACFSVIGEGYGDWKSDHSDELRQLVVEIPN